jgi:protein-L-isoaspartate O-methyltransferase
LVKQLAPGGKMFIPAGSPQQIYHVEKDLNGVVSTKAAMGVRYVPLTSAQQQLNFEM